MGKFKILRGLHFLVDAKFHSATIHIMKYFRYILIAVMLYLLSATLYSYLSPDLIFSSDTNALDLDPKTYDIIKSKFRATVLPYIPMFGLLLTGWLFLAKRPIAYSAALISILLLGFIIWKDINGLAWTPKQQMIAVEHGLASSLTWRSAFYFLSALMIFLPNIKWKNSQNKHTSASQSA